MIARRGGWTESATHEVSESTTGVSDSTAENCLAVDGSAAVAEASRAAIARAVPGCGRLRLEVSRDGQQDRMHLRAEHADPATAATLAEKLAELTRLKGSVEVVTPGSLPNDGKVIADLR